MFIVCHSDHPAILHALPLVRILGHIVKSKSGTIVLVKENGGLFFQREHVSFHKGTCMKNG